MAAPASSEGTLASLSFKLYLVIRSGWAFFSAGLLLVAVALCCAAAVVSGEVGGGGGWNVIGGYEVDTWC